VSYDPSKVFVNDRQRGNAPIGRFTDTSSPPPNQRADRLHLQSMSGNNQEEGLSLVRAAAAASSPQNPGNGGQFPQPANSESARTGPIDASTTDSIDVLLDNGSSKGT
jgi:hypothetical protein